MMLVDRLETHGPISNRTGLSPFELKTAPQDGAINKLDRPQVKGGAMIEQCSELLGSN